VNVALILDSATNDIAVLQMLQPASFTQIKAVIMQDIQTARETLDLKTDGHTFFFLNVQKLLECQRLPNFQDLFKMSGWLVEEVVSVKDILSGRRADLGVLSYTWLSKSHPDPQGVLLEILKEFLERHPEITKIWIDFCCLPQGRCGRKLRKVFNDGLNNINFVYLHAKVIIMFSPSFLDRFWPRFESFLSFQQVTNSGLVLAEPPANFVVFAGAYRMHTHIGKATWNEFRQIIASSTIEDMIDLLADPNLNITSGSDRIKCLGKVGELQDYINKLRPHPETAVAATETREYERQATHEAGEGVPVDLEDLQAFVVEASEGESISNHNSAPIRAITPSKRALAQPIGRSSFVESKDFNKI